MTRPTFFRTPAAFRQWLVRNHASAGELWVGFYKKDSGKPSITWPESVDQALCFGWIDGIRKSVDDTSYTIRFSPRRRGSTWSTVNIRKVEVLNKTGQMQPAGLAAYKARQPCKSGIYSYEQRPLEMPEPYARLLQKNKGAWQFVQSQRPSYRRLVNWWIVSAKKEETRLKRLKILLGYSAKRQTLPALTPVKSVR